MDLFLEKKNGFTIIELVISIFVFCVGVIAIFSALSAINILTAGSSDSLTGTYLAQEGLEIVRNIRDTNWLNMQTCINSGIGSCSYTWLDGLSCAQGCEVDYQSKAVSFSLGDYLEMDSNGFYSYQGGTHAKFKRKITITPVTDVDGKSDHIVDVMSQVSWDAKATLVNSSGFSADNCQEGSNCVKAEETLYDWYNYTASQ